MEQDLSSNASRKRSKVRAATKLLKASRLKERRGESGNTSIAYLVKPEWFRCRPKSARSLGLFCVFADTCLRRDLTNEQFELAYLMFDQAFRSDPDRVTYHLARLPNVIAVCPVHARLGDTSVVRQSLPLD